MTPTEQQEPPMRSPRNDDWIEWTGGECPVKSPETQFMVRYSDGATSDTKQNGAPFLWDWICGGEGGDIIAYRITENHEPQEADMRADMDPINGGERKYADAAQTIGIQPKTTPTRADLIAQRDAKLAEAADLDAQMAAMPETVRVWAWFQAGRWFFGADYWGKRITHYRDFPLINGVPEGFVPVEGV